MNHAMDGARLKEPGGNLRRHGRCRTGVPQAEQWHSETGTEESTNHAVWGTGVGRRATGKSGIADRSGGHSELRNGPAKCGPRSNPCSASNNERAECNID